ncbi:ubr1 ubiquitin ligase isoform X2 [Brevipalpus obovatus]|uniref:ubr1 ubiquitin ligase isoform X2 n=1 Tax=Brevipalpus obovatus TaxID=246614 RepID=UPI003D9EC678
MVLPPKPPTEESDSQFVEDDLDYQKWTTMFMQGTLDSRTIRSYWAEVVPRIYSPKRGCNCLNIAYDEELARENLFQPLELFIARDGEPKKLFESLKQTDKDPSLCGKLFKNGEPVYSCRDCSLDSTCVVCVDCFKRSAHQNHKYRMSTSSGSGYCDCGDPEAWRSNIFCDLHIKGCEEGARDEDPRKRLPEDLAARADFMIRIIVRYCFEMLEWTNPTTLPDDLQAKSEAVNFDAASEDYVTMLSNDEIHTYEQVIQTLSRAIECSTKEAVEYATTIDHEGRSIVKCATFDSCSQVKQMIEKITGRQGTKPLKCDVLRTNVIAHQAFAMRLLSWLQQLISYCEGFKSIFASIMMEQRDFRNSASLLEAIMQADVKLWKTARNAWHQIFIIGLLMNTESKKAFAKTFTRIYSGLLKEFIQDDHEHSVSIASIAVQIFTVPSLSHTLIAEDEAFFILISTFYNECKGHVSPNTGKLQFERNHNTINTFKRVQFILHDLKYLLAIKPTSWTPQLRASFQNGFKKLIELLACMQGMDSVVRQIGAHVEFEAEWETGINLQLKLAPVLSLVIEWCGSDQQVLYKALKHALKQLDERLGTLSYEEQSLYGHQAQCIQYDVSSLAVTVHLPLSRLVAGLLLHAAIQDVNTSSVFHTGPDFLPDCPPPDVLMELPLRTLVLVAQFRAGMWRRNGYSLVNQVYFYHNARLRDEMYDRDIMMLQYAAASIDPNIFLIQLLHKFGLLYWAGDKYDSRHRKPEEDHLRQTVQLVEEFFNLLLVIISERFVPGIGQVSFEDRMKREIIHWLCTDSMTHSDLLKCLPKEISDEVIIEKLIQEVADFKRPSPDQPGGKYELKDEFYTQFNPFFYHYTRQDQSTAEEVQIKRRRSLKEKLICCPPPVPPDFTRYFGSIVKILQSEIFLRIVNLVLKRTCNPNSLSFSETQFEKVLHLIGVALHEEIKILNRGSNPQNFKFFDSATSAGLLDNLKACMNCSRIGSHRDLLTWTLKQFSEVAKLRGNLLPGTSTIGLIDQSSDEKSNKKDSDKAKLIAQRKARILAQMKERQTNFIQDNFEWYEISTRDPRDLGYTGAGSMMDLSGSDDNTRSSEPCAVGPNQRCKDISNEFHICILCREEQATEMSAHCMVLAAFVQGSTVLSKDRCRKDRREDNCEIPLVPSDLSFGCHVSTCGHVMHSECWTKFFEAVLNKERRRPLRYGRHISFDVDKNEFLCPLCECLSNAVIPLIPPSLYRDLDPEQYTAELDFEIWISNLSQICVADLTTNNDEKSLIDKISSKERRVKARPPFGSSQEPIDIVTFSKELAEKFSNDTKEMMKNLTKSISEIYVPRADKNGSSPPIFAYRSAAFTIHAIERVLRDEGKSIFGDLSSRRYNCLQALVRYVGVLSFGDDCMKIRSYCIGLLKYLLLSDHYEMNRSCLDVDAFSLLLILVLTSPALSLKSLSEDLPSILIPIVPNGSSSDLHFITLITVFHCIQIILTNKNLTSPDSDLMEVDTFNDEEDESELRFVDQFYTKVLESSLSNLNSSREQENSQLYDKLRSQQLLKILKVKLLPFFRCSAVFFHFLTGVTPPGRLKEGESQSFPCPEIEFALLCEYLGLPSKLSLFFKYPKVLWNLVEMWCKHPAIKSRAAELSNLSSPSSSSPLDASFTSQPQQRQQSNVQQTVVSNLLIAQPHTVNQLINLPKDYSELINSVSQFTCPKSDGDDARTPTMCLVCGTILCSQSYCCQVDVENTLVGACTCHAHDCGAGVGIFLRIRDCKILLLAGRSKGCYMPPPYIDEYGETDQGLFRGNPLTLCESSYKELHRLWLRHGIPEQVAHSLELHSNMATVNWVLL